MFNKTLANLNFICRPDKRPLNILTIPTHEGFQDMLSKTGHNFYMLSGPGLKTWDHHTRKLPDNHYIYNLPYNEIRGAERFDVVLCQNRIQQWDVLANIAARLSLPLIVLDHTEPPPNINQQDFQVLLGRTGNINVFITEHNQQSWMNVAGHVIRHGIDTETFKGYNGENASGVSVVNQFAQRDVFCGWNLWQSIQEEVPVALFGDNGELSESINNSEELANKIGQYRFFLNTSQYSPIPLSVMEAMSVGLPIVSTAKQEIPKIVRHGVDGFLSNDRNELIGYCRQLLEDPDLAKEMGQNARQNIIENYSIGIFVEKWNEIFYNAYRRQF